MIVPMTASEKMVGFGLKGLAHSACVDLVTVYRWKKAIENGRGVRDSVKRSLIEATADSTHAIVWSDFALQAAQS